MNRTFNWITRICLILGTLLVSSCLDVREEFWIYEDGRAEAEITCHMTKAATLVLGGPEGAKAMAEKMLADEKSIDSYKVQVTESEKRVSLKVQCSVNDLLDFDTLRKSIQSHKELHPAVRKMVGDFDIHVEGLSGIEIRRTVAPGEAVPALKWLPKSQTEGHRMVKIMHFPHPITDHNARETWDDGRTLMWESTLADAIRSPLVYEFVIPYPLPWAWITAACISLAAVMVCIILLAKKRRQQRAGSAKKG